GIGRETAAADRRVEHADAFRARCRCDLLHRRRRSGGRDGDDRSPLEIGKQAAVAVDNRLHLLRIADPDDDEVGLARERGRRVGRPGACGLRLLQRLRAEITGGDAVAALEEVLEHRKPHPPDADDADALFFVIGHGLSFSNYALALSNALSGFVGSARWAGSTATRRSMRRRAAAISRCTLIPVAKARRSPSSSKLSRALPSSARRTRVVGCGGSQPTPWM